ncbi:RHS repeat-associated core domain-containing protein, partial [Marinilabiliaceae bacterium JC040]|nr:RHS repeat-associated core domain-containing protein [Marinilabiliaceae bacterium JC040]
YNSLNLPKEILIQNQRIRYMYSSGGEKLQNILPSKTLTYSNGFVYENGSLSYILTSVGRYVVNGSSGKYEYNICDHLGNVRAVVDDSGELLQQNDYYPFGGLMSSFGGSDNKYLYNGKELQEGTDWLDYGARMYDGYLGRWSCVDPMAEKNNVESPYVYVHNNPINVIDPDGRDGVYIVFPDYKANGYPMTGHAGILLINNKTGLTKYYEYGRYDDEKKGVVRSYTIPNVVIGEEGRPTAKSLAKVMGVISSKSGKGKKIEGAYFKSNKFDKMNNYAKKKEKENKDIKRKPYSIISNNCGTFADDVVKQDKDVNAPFILDPRPVSIIEEYQNNLTPVSFDPQNGATIKYDSSTAKTTKSKSWWERLFHIKDKN